MIQNILSLNLSPQNLSPQNISKHILSSTKLITTKLIKLQNLSSIITYQNKTYQLQNLSNKTYQATKLIKLQSVSNSKLIHESKISNHGNAPTNPQIFKRKYAKLSVSRPLSRQTWFRRRSKSRYKFCFVLKSFFVG